MLFVFLVTDLFFLVTDLPFIIYPNDSTEILPCRVIFPHFICRIIKIMNFIPSNISVLILGSLISWTTGQYGGKWVKTCMFNFARVLHFRLWCMRTPSDGHTPSRPMSRWPWWSSTCTLARPPSSSWKGHCTVAGQCVIIHQQKVYQ